MSVTQDINGKESSKRYWAKRFFTLGFYLAIFLFLFWAVAFVAFDKDFKVPDELIEILKWLMGFASAVILGTLFEQKNK